MNLRAARFHILKLYQQAQILNELIASSGKMNTLIQTRTQIAITSYILCCKSTNDQLRYTFSQSKTKTNSMQLS
jgi:hypothetical protein